MKQSYTRHIGLQTEQIKSTTGWGRTTIQGVKSSPDFETYRQANAERVKKSNEKRRQTTVSQLEIPQVNSTEDPNEEPVHDLLGQQEFLEVYKEQTLYLKRIAVALEDVNRTLIKNGKRKLF